MPWSWSSNATADKLLFSLTLQQSAELFERFGESHQAQHYRQLAAEINRETYASQFDPQRGLLRDTPERDFTQEVNTLAVLADAIPHDAQRGVMERMLNDPSGVKSEPSDFMFFRYYFGRALREDGTRRSLY